MTLNKITTQLESIGRFLEREYHNKPLPLKDKEMILKDFGVSEKAFDKVFLHFCSERRGTKIEKRKYNKG